MRAVLRFALAGALAQQGRDVEAAETYRDLFRLRPDSPAVRERLAMFLATANDPAVRDPSAAVALAEEACRMTGRKDPELLRTLAVAYTAAGRPRDAADTAGEAVALARSSGRHELANEIAEELAHPLDRGRP